jgi:hypothetical protein
MMLVSFLRCAAATWMEFAISRMDAMSTTIARMNEPSRTRAITSSRVFSAFTWFSTPETPGWSW